MLLWTTESDTECTRNKLSAEAPGYNYIFFSCLCQPYEAVRVFLLLAFRDSRFTLCFIFISDSRRRPCTDFHCSHALVSFWLSVFHMIKKFLQFLSYNSDIKLHKSNNWSFLCTQADAADRSALFQSVLHHISIRGIRSPPLLWLCISKEKGEGWIYARWFRFLSTVYGGVNWIKLSLTGAEGADIHPSVQEEDHFQLSFRERQGYTLLPVEGYSASLETPHCSGGLLHKSHRKAEKNGEMKSGWRRRYTVSRCRWGFIAKMNWACLCCNNVEEVVPSPWYEAKRNALKEIYGGKMLTLAKHQTLNCVTFKLVKCSMV